MKLKRAISVSDEKLLFQLVHVLPFILQVSGKPINRKPQSTTSIVSTNNSDIIYDARIDDGRLYYDKKWFHRQQPVFVVSKDIGKDSYVITAVGTQEVSSCMVLLCS